MSDHHEQGDLARQNDSARQNDLEGQFEHDMIETVYRTTGRDTGYWAAYFLRAVKRHGGVTAARRMLGAKGISQGLAKLQAKGRLDLAMETLVLKPEYRMLFTDDERAIAARRLAHVESPGEVGAIAGSVRTSTEPREAHPAPPGRDPGAPGSSCR